MREFTLCQSLSTVTQVIRYYFFCFVVIWLHMIYIYIYIYVCVGKTSSMRLRDKNKRGTLTHETWFTRTKLWYYKFHHRLQTVWFSVSGQVTLLQLKWLLCQLTVLVVCKILITTQFCLIMISTCTTSVSILVLVLANQYDCLILVLLLRVMLPSKTKWDVMLSSFNIVQQQDHYSQHYHNGK